MQIKEIVELLNAEVLTGGDKLEREVNMAFASDLMSDVLAFGANSDFLITGLANAQAVRTAEMMDIDVILFVRDKRLDPSIVELAEEMDVIVLDTSRLMFDTCGTLYQAGLRGVKS